MPASTKYGGLIPKNFCKGKLTNACSLHVLVNDKTQDKIYFFFF